MDVKLYEAALMGNVQSLFEILVEDPLILERVSVKESPLHTAALLGHVDFAKEILRRKPQLARESNSQGFSPLHLASAKGHLEIVKELLKADSDMCLVRDRDGRTPLHIAAMNGRADILKELVRARPVATRVTTDRAETVFHVCVKHKHLEVLKVLVEARDDGEVVRMKDDGDNTVLHLATAEKQIQMVEYLVSKTKVDVNAINISGLTAFDILLNSPHERADKELKAILKKVGARSAEEIFHPSPGPISLANEMELPTKRRKTKKRKRDHDRWLDETRSTLMVVAILIATETFEAGLNPPGSVWQDTLEDNTGSGKGHTAGEAIMSYIYWKEYRVFMIFNSTGFISSLLIILLLISGFPLERRVLLWILTIFMWVAVSSMMVTYGCSLYTLSSDEVFNRIPWLTVRNTFFTWLGIIGLLFVGHLYRFASRRFKNLQLLRKKDRLLSMDKRNVGLVKKKNKRYSTDERNTDVELNIG
ncbi:ankyrin repeat-containing protein BDA1-like [Magnolia sinica]|uniref:ankyrin repeat-containing protein BDA1-like n=1 Tax=Magnolia sinica TaxID=86752 RepID=UPI00265908FD|nr:ankyrin repeat-containing protein BDA1-like [Magnolia sinica]